LTIIFLQDNLLTDIDVSKNVLLRELYLSDNLLTHLDVTKNTQLTDLYLLGNQICTLDITQNTLLLPANLKWVAWTGECYVPEVVPEIIPETIPETAAETTPVTVPTAPNTAIQKFILANPVIVAALGITTAAAIFMAARRQLGKK